VSRLAQVEARLVIIEMEGAMPADDIQVKRIPAVRVAELTATAAHLEPAFISPVIQPLYEELGSRLGRAGVVPAGRAIAYYEDAPDGDGVIIHATMPVSAGPVSGHDFEITDLPEIRHAATLTRRGAAGKHHDCGLVHGKDRGGHRRGLRHGPRAGPPAGGAGMLGRGL
jgi:hypothetical protein